MYVYTLIYFILMIETSYLNYSGRSDLLASARKNWNYFWSDSRSTFFAGLFQFNQRILLCSPCNTYGHHGFPNLQNNHASSSKNFRWTSIQVNYIVV